jgi:uncharacterized membrane protein YoaK (UPF0700 family)
MVVAFFAGAFVASMPLESNIVRRRSHAYGLLLLLEAVLLGTFAALSYFMDTHEPRFHDVQAMLLCFAMGLQNSLVTRLSGAIVRTTHLTGAVTDLAIECARWFRHWRHRIGARTHVRLIAGEASTIPPHKARSLLLLTLVVAFIVGSAAGAILAARFGQLALVAPTILLLIGAISALREKSLLGRVLSRIAHGTSASTD